MKSTTLAFALILTVSALTGQTVYKPPSTTFGTTYCSDKLAVTGFSLNPPQPAANQMTTARMTIKNQCSSGALNVPWQIARNNTFIGSGTVSINAGTTATVSAYWTAFAGSHNFYGDADNNKTLGDGNMSNNITQNIALTVAPIIEEQLLNIDRAKMAGASFPNNPESGDTSGYLLEGQCYVNQGGGYVTVPTTAQITMGGYVGGKANPELFKNFQLKNGWKIRNVSIIDNYVSNGDWRWLSGAPGPPLPDQTNPAMQFHLWVNPMGRVELCVEAKIYGPKGRNPYACESGYNCTTGLPQ